MSLAPNKFRNNSKAVSIASEFWKESEKHGLVGIVAELDRNGYLRTAEGHKFKNLSCCSYLDLDSHPEVIKGAISALNKYGVLDHCISRIRVQMPALLELEGLLSQLFDTKIISAISASAATAGVLPFLASGHFTNGKKPTVVFDKNSHFSMNLCKPICADETEVLTCPHNDLNYVEDICKKNNSVAYVCDGTYSMGGFAPVKELMYLQEKYGLFLYFDDSHSLSILGQAGEGYVRSQLDHVNELTIIVATLNKAFGASGGIMMFGPKTVEEALIVERFGGPLAWSQPMNTAAIGGAIGSARLHSSPELKLRQEQLQKNIKIFDGLILTEQSGTPFPIRMVSTTHDEAIFLGRELYKAGFYVSPVFFPIVAKDKAGLRVMLRSSLKADEIQRLCRVIDEVRSIRV